jgi:hypothetical protein
MEHWWVGLQMSKFKQRELLEDVARFRLIEDVNRGLHGSGQKLHHSRPGLQFFWYALRGNLGRRLIDWGTMLQGHHGAHR